MKVLGFGKEFMKCTYIIGIVVLGAMGVQAQTHDVEVKIKGIRSETGNILIMALTDKESQPIYGSAKAKRGQVTITLKGLTDEKYMLSAFHDAPRPRAPAPAAPKRPPAGVAQSYYQFEPGKTGCKMTLYYLPNPE